MWRFGLLITGQKAVKYQFDLEKDRLIQKKEEIDYDTNSSVIMFDVLKDGRFYYALDRKTLKLTYGATYGYDCLPTENAPEFHRQLNSVRSSIMKQLASERSSNKI